MSAFAADWLRQREPFDAAARSVDLARRFGAVLAGEPGAPRRIVDLAAGSGANFMALAPVIGGHQDWLLVDNDPSLLAAQAEEIGRRSRDAGWSCRGTDDGMLLETGSARWRVRAQCLDLAVSVENVDVGSCDGITTSAFLDLASATWLDRLCGLLVRHAVPLLATLTVDGRREWHPALPGDARVHDAFLRHQARDKGFGPALGGRAAHHLAKDLAARGYEMSTAASDWRIGVEHRAMLLRMVRDTVAAASEAEPAASALFANWSKERQAHVRAGVLTLEVGHLDLLAVPPAGQGIKSQNKN